MSALARVNSRLKATSLFIRKASKTLFRFIFLLNLSFSHLTQLPCTYCNTCYFHSHSLSHMDLNSAIFLLGLTFYCDISKKEPFSQSCLKMCVISPIVKLLLTPHYDSGFSLCLSVAWTCKHFCPPTRLNKAPCSATRSHQNA